MSTSVSIRHGKFINKLKLEKLLHAGNEYTFVLKDEFVYRDSYGHNWKAHIDDVIDGSSLPPIAWEIFGSPFESQFLNAFVIFETACNRREQIWEITHEVLYEASLTCGLDDVSAKILFACAYYFGQHWSSKFEADKIYFNILKQSMFTIKDFFELKYLIETKNLPLQDIMDYEPEHIHDMPLYLQKLN